MEEPTPAQRMRALYDAVPAIVCKRKCQAFCTAVFDDGAAVSLLERDRVATLHGARPSGPGHACGYLDDAGRCGVYSMRPLICRLWGAVDSPGMRCPHGCKPERYLTHAESMALFAEAVAIGGIAPPTEHAASAREREEGMLMLAVGYAAEHPEVWGAVEWASSAINVWRKVALRRAGS